MGRSTSRILKNGGIVEKTKKEEKTAPEQMKEIWKEEKPKSIYQVLAEAKKELSAVTKDKENPFHKSKYADINSYLNVIEPVLQKYGLVLIQPLSNGGECFYLKTIIVLAETGESIESILPLPNGLEPQKLGSAITYYRRYTLASLLAMQAEDDDAHAASVKEIKPIKKVENSLSTKPIKLFKYNVSSLISDDFKTWIADKTDMTLIGDIVTSNRKIDKWDQFLISPPVNGNGSTSPTFKGDK